MGILSWGVGGGGGVGSHTILLHIHGYTIYNKKYFSER